MQFNEYLLAYVFPCESRQSVLFIHTRLLTQYAIFLPSSIVLSDSTELFGPSPTEVNANTWNSYSVYSSSPVTTFNRVDPLLIVIWVDDPEEPFSLYNSLNPLMTPFLSSVGGNCQDASILVEFLTVRDKLLGGCVGTANGQLENWIISPPQETCINTSWFTCI